MPEDLLTQAPFIEDAESAEGLNRNLAADGR